MSGNAGEWCSDYYDEIHYHVSPGRDPRGPADGGERVLRGGGYMETRMMVSATYRIGTPEDFRRDSVGFRCAADAD